MKKENRQQCEPCEEQFEQNIDRMVDNVKGYTSTDRKERRQEVNQAFGTKENPATKGRDGSAHRDTTDKKEGEHRHTHTKSETR